VDGRNQQKREGRNFAPFCGRKGRFYCNAKFLKKRCPLDQRVEKEKFEDMFGEEEGEKSAPFQCVSAKRIGND